MKPITLSALLFTITLQGCADGEQATRKNGDNRPCVANYSAEGSFWSGRQLKTFEDFPKALKVSTFDNLLETIAFSGYQIISSDQESGVISASQTVTGGQGKAVPLNAVVQNNSAGGVRVELVVTLLGGFITSTDSLQDEFCKILASVNQNKN
ncbi:MAG: hypothetical protein HOP02_05750 [Methylococcaceae bacterium]|nr:hypothetical protein [Methylococcaceae bacterium]